MYEPYDWEIEAEAEERSYAHNLRITGATDDFPEATKWDYALMALVLLILFVVAPYVQYKMHGG